ncbi:MAG: sigma-54 dependent transcriptional regulator [Bryobacteraceae bacterium]|nr:sigma-54 dependent transcriptional regulator [Bryobacteraceae bacterium]
MSKILVVDDERNVLSAFEKLLGGNGHEVATERRAAAGLERLQREPFDLVILDIRMPGMDGLEALRQIKQHRPQWPVIIVTGQGTMETAIEATQCGAFDYQLKPFEPEEVLAVVERALEGARMMKGHVAVDPEEDTGSEAIIGRSPGMQEVYKTIGRVAAADVTVLIRGESGTGKELVARAIYQHSRRSTKPLLVVNCAAIPETLLEGELFGYERGAFTGAVGRRIGKFEQAHQGTIFLDEIGDAPLAIQAKILRMLQEKTFERLGGNETIRVDVRVLAATNRDLEKAIAEGGFRPDLYHRLNVVSIHVPPLRERRGDIPRLADYFLVRFAREMDLDKPLLAEDVVKSLESYPWPGNVRELEHCIRRAVIFTRGYPIQARDLPFNQGGQSKEQAGEAPSFNEERLFDLVRGYLDICDSDRAFDGLVEKLEHALLTEALKRTHGNRTHAAQLLGLPRGTFFAKVQKHGLREGSGS